MREVVEPLAQLSALQGHLVLGQRRHLAPSGLVVQDRGHHRQVNDGDGQAVPQGGGEGAWTRVVHASDQPHAPRVRREAEGAEERGCPPVLAARWHQGGPGGAPHLGRRVVRVAEVAQHQQVNGLHTDVGGVDGAVIHCPWLFGRGLAALRAGSCALPGRALGLLIHRGRALGLLIHRLPLLRLDHLGLLIYRSQVVAAGVCQRAAREIGLRLPLNLYQRAVVVLRHHLHHGRRRPVHAVPKRDVVLHIADKRQASRPRQRGDVSDTHALAVDHRRERQHEAGGHLRVLANGCLGDGVRQERLVLRRREGAHGTRKAHHVGAEHRCRCETEALCATRECGRNEGAGDACG